MNTCDTLSPVTRSTPAFPAELHIILTHDRKLSIKQCGDVGAILSILVSHLSLFK